MKKTTKKTAKKTVKKVVKKAAKKAAKKVVKKTAKKVVKKVVKKAAKKKTAAKKVVKKTAKKAPKGRVKATRAKSAGATRAKGAGATRATAKKGGAGNPKTAKKTVAKPATAKKPSRSSSPKSTRGVVTTILPPKLTNSRVASSPRPAQSAVKARKAPQAKLSLTAAAPQTRKRLNKEELKFFERLLNDKKETLLKEQTYLEDNALRLNSKEGAGDLSSHAYHLADHATETQDREQAFHLASREGKFLFYIEEALDRVRAGTFGICKKCGTLIPKARLEAVPTAKMCINCKSQQEHATEADAPA